MTTLMDIEWPEPLLDSLNNPALARRINEATASGIFDESQTKANRSELASNGVSAASVWMFSSVQL